MDDILITGPNSTSIATLITKLQSDFPLKDLRQLHYFLGMKVLQDVDHGLFLSQKQYILDLLLKSNMINAKPVNSLMTSSKSISRFDSAAFADPSLYRSVVGSLPYISLTRLDVSFAVNKVCQFLQRPTINHWAVVKRILHYLKHTLYHGLFFR